MAIASSPDQQISATSPIPAALQ